MSGPKSSIYDITAIQRRILQEQRREEERRRREAEQRRREIERRRIEEEKRRLEMERQARIKKSDDVIDKAFESFSTLEPKKISAAENLQKNFDATKFLNQLNLFAQDSRLSAELINKIEQTKNTFEKISDPTYRKNFTALNITPLLKECAEYLKIYDEISALAIDYKIACEMAGEVETHFEISSENVSKMTAEIKRLREKIDGDAAKFYISKSIDEVMAEMGYNVLGSREVTKKSGKHFKSEIFSYSDGTAVNVTASDSGQIVMELCGLDEVDRTPEFAESEQLCRDMENFCEDFSEIERRLAEKGVVLRSRIQKLPPNVEYAQILNVNDYELSGEVENFRTKRRHEKSLQHRSKRHE